MKESAIDLFLAHVNDGFERPSRLVPNLPMWLDTLICQLMEKKPEMRPIDAAMVGRALEEIAEKVATHKSVGQEVANARVIDRVQMTAPPDESDRAASRVIRSSAKRKKVKKRAVPFYRKAWFSLAASALVIAALGYGAFQLFKAPDPAIAFKAAQEEKDDEQRERLFAEYAKRFEATKGDNWQKARDEVLNLKAKKSDAAMWNRFRRHLGPEENFDKDAYELVMRGLTQEREGDAGGAADTWKKLADGWADRSTDELLIWGWLGRRHLKLGKEIDALERQLAEAITKAEVEEEEPTFESDERKRATDALRAEKFGDPTKVAAVWKSMRGEAREKELAADKRDYLLLAARHAREAETRKDATPVEREKVPTRAVGEGAGRQEFDERRPAAHRPQRPADHPRPLPQRPAAVRGHRGRGGAGAEGDEVISWRLNSRSGRH